MSDISALHAHTSVLTVIEPRGFPVRSVSLYRTRSGQFPCARVERSAYDAAGRCIERWDPRLWAANNALDPSGNRVAIHSLTGKPLLSDSVDAGWRVELRGVADQRERYWDAKGQLQRFEYDDLLRPVAVFEDEGVVERCVERLAYGQVSDSLTNQCGQLIRHDDPAGSLINVVFGLTGSMLEQTRCFLSDFDTPDWPESIDARNPWLEPGVGARTRWQVGPLGDVIEQIDAVGNVQRFAQTLAGQLRGSGVQLQGQALKELIRDIHYDAQGRIESEMAGNGVVAQLSYDPADGRLLNLRADKGRLQNLNYRYDPAGNIVSIEDTAQPTRYFANQRIEPLRTFVYDTLYQLIEATGYEAASLNQGPDAARRASFATANELGRYTQHYEYDASGNLQKLVHSGTQNHTRRIATARASNRSLSYAGERPPSEEQIAAGFDLNGNLLELAPGQALSWDARNQLNEVTPVRRDSGLNDSEIYRYDGTGMRVRKVHMTQAGAVSHQHEVRYLPGIEIRRNTATGELLHIVEVSAGQGRIRVLHWQAGRPAEINNDQIRYCLTDHLGSSTLELDGDAALISQETYYPYGETAWFAARSEVQAAYKTVCYSGKEQDVTGLYYYGLRYYAPWLMRWLNPDPAGDIDGLNLYRMSRNHPLNYKDAWGLNGFDTLNEHAEFVKKENIQFLALGLNNFPASEQQAVRSSLTLGLGWLRDIKKQLKADPWGGLMHHVLSRVMGADSHDEQNDPAGLRTALSKRFEKIEAVINTLDDARSPKMILVEMSGDVGALTVPSNVHGNMIWLSRSTVNDNHPVLLTSILIHESSHVVPVARGFYTYDYWYLTSSFPKTASSEDMEFYSSRMLELSRNKLVGPDESKMGTNDRSQYIEQIDSKLASVRRPASAGPEQRRQLFRDHALVRQSVVMRNADSLAVMAMQFHRYERAA